MLPSEWMAVCVRLCHSVRVCVCVCVCTQDVYLRVYSKDRDPKLLATLRQAVEGYTQWAFDRTGASLKVQGHTHTQTHAHNRQMYNNTSRTSLVGAQKCADTQVRALGRRHMVARRYRPAAVLCAQLCSRHPCCCIGLVSQGEPLLVCMHASGT